MKFPLPIFSFILLLSLVVHALDSGKQPALVKTVPAAADILKWHFTPQGAFSQGRNQLWIPGEKPNTFSTDGILLNTVYSRQNLYYATIVLEKTAEKASENGLIAITVFSGNAGRLYCIEVPYTYDQPYPSVCVLDQGGALIIGQNDTGRVRFYSGNGTHFEEIELFPGSRYDMERPLYMDPGADGKKIIIAAQERGASPAGSPAPEPDGNPNLFLFSHDGRLIWQKELPEYATSGVALSPDGEHIIADNYTMHSEGRLIRKAHLLDARGTITNTFDFLFRNARFSADSKHLLISSNRFAKLYDLDADRFTWNYTVDDPSAMIAAGDISSDGSVTTLLLGNSAFVQESGFVFKNPRLLIYASSEEKETLVPVEGILHRNPEVWIAPETTDIYVGFKNSYHIYRVQ